MPKLKEINVDKIFYLMDKGNSEEIIEYISKKYKENTEENFLNFLFQDNTFDEDYPVILSLIFLPEINSYLKRIFDSLSIDALKKVIYFKNVKNNNILSYSLIAENYEMFFYFLQILKTKKIEITEEFEGFCYLLGLLDIISYLYLLEYDLLLKIDLDLLEEIYNRFNFCNTLSYYISDYDTIIKSPKLFSFLEKVFKRWKKEKDFYLSIILNSLEEETFKQIVPIIKTINWNEKEKIRILSNLFLKERFEIIKELLSEKVFSENNFVFSLFYFIFLSEQVFFKDTERTKEFLLWIRDNFKSEEEIEFLNKIISNVKEDFTEDNSERLLWLRENIKEIQI